MHLLLFHTTMFSFPPGKVTPAKSGQTTTGHTITDYVTEKTSNDRSTSMKLYRICKLESVQEVTKFLQQIRKHSMPVAKIHTNSCSSPVGKRQRLANEVIVID